MPPKKQTNKMMPTEKWLALQHKRIMEHERWKQKLYEHEDYVLHRYVRGYGHVVTRKSIRPRVVDNRKKWGFE